jgi:hypothetical protein
VTGWIERYRRKAEARFSRLDDVLAELDAPRPIAAKKSQNPQEEAPT